jgi:serine/threonine protein phosphatase PrpC
MQPTAFLRPLQGDSRAVLQRGATTVTRLSNDHKPIKEDEAMRINTAGGVIINGAIGGRLAVSRGLGDFAFKHTASVLYAADSTNSEVDDYVRAENQMVTSVPEISVLERQADDKFIVVACDGIWDVISNENCAKLISTIFNEGERSVSLACEEVLDQCYAKGSLDNMTAILITFRSQDIGLGGGVMKRRKQRLRKG